MINTKDFTGTERGLVLDVLKCVRTNKIENFSIEEIARVFKSYPTQPVYKKVFNKLISNGLIMNDLFYIEDRRRSA